jgi:hypothetical protein
VLYFHPDKENFQEIMAFMSAKNNGVICAFVDIIPVE